MNVPDMSPRPSVPGAPSSLHGETAKWRRWVMPVLVLTVLLIATLAAHDALRTTNYHAVMRAVEAVPRHAMLNAIVLTIACYLVLPMYDVLGLRYAGTPMPLLRSMQASWFAYAFSQTLGFAAITGGAFRLRFWTAAGLTTGDVARAASFSAIGFWIGILTMCGLALTFEPLPTAVLVYASSAAPRVVGVLLLAVVANYVVVACVRRRPMTVVGITFTPPGPALTWLQLLVAATDWTSTV